LYLQQAQLWCAKLLVVLGRSTTHTHSHSPCVLQAVQLSESCQSLCNHTHSICHGVTPCCCLVGTHLVQGWPQQPQSVPQVNAGQNPGRMPWSNTGVQCRGVSCGWVDFGVVCTTVQAQRQKRLEAVAGQQEHADSTALLEPDCCGVPTGGWGACTGANMFLFHSW